MAEWKTQIHFNYNHSYHSYAYNFMFPPGTEQNPLNLVPWTEPGVADLCNNFSPAQGYYSPAAAAPTEAPPPQQQQVPETHAYDLDLGQYQDTGMVYLEDTEAGQMLLGGQPRENEGSGSISDSEPQTSPDSWSSGSCGEVLIPQADPATWAHKTHLEDEISSNSPDSTEDISAVLEQHTYCAIGNEGSSNIATIENASVIAPKTQSTKGKVRAAFSETQMNVLTQRFNLQRYLTPAEMKSMAELTGLTYKQVKTWFQNRRMKLRRHQKDNSWASERYTLNKNNAGQGAPCTSLPTHMQHYQRQAMPALKEHYNPHVDAAMNKTAPPNLALYLAAVGGGNGSTGYPNWSTNTGQGAVHSRPQAPSWPLPPDAPQYGYNARFNAQSLSNVHDLGFKEEEQVNKATYNPLTL